MKSKEAILQELQEAQWDIQGFNSLPLYLWCAAASGWSVERILGVRYRHFFYLYPGPFVHMYYDLRDLETIGDAFYRKFTDLGDLQRLHRQYEQEYRQAVRRELPHNWQRLDLPALCALVTELCQEIVEAISFAHMIEGVNWSSERRLRDSLQKHGLTDESAFIALSSPASPSFAFQAQEALWKIKQATGEKRRGLLTEFQKDFYWLDTTYIGLRPISEEEIIRRAEQLESEPKTDHLREAGNHKQELLEKLECTAEERFVVQTIEYCFRWQDDRKKHILQAIARLDPVMERLGELSGNSPLHLKYALPEEFTVEKLIDTAFKQELTERAHGAAYYQSPEQASVYTGEDFRFFTEGLHTKLEDGLKEVKGIAASKGIVQGTARVCTSFEDIGAVQSGEILVTTMTRPEYLPAMQKAAAFVTDEGGITCHAAIVAREMNKPCIIGTKIATKLITTGDLIEVDANQGIVSILNR